MLRLAVHGGFLEVDTSPGAAEGFAEGDGPLPGLSTKVTVLAGVAELAQEIDVPRAERAREAATQHVAELSSGRGGGADQPAGSDAPDVPLQEAEAALGRAELRLSVAGSHE
jgi:F0F1-type ATP synthase epsilon subunit